MFLSYLLEMNCSDPSVHPGSDDEADLSFSAPLQQKLCLFKSEIKPFPLQHILIKVSLLNSLISVEALD